MRSKIKKAGFTVIEMLIAISLFMVLAVTSSNIIVDIFRLEKTSDFQNSLYADLRIILQQITNEIQNGTIDYEEYYNMYVTKSDFYGINYGVYGSRFYDPGERLDGKPASNPDDLGAECSFPAGGDLDSCEVIYTLSVDADTGQNPFFSGDSREAEDANALCDGGNQCSRFSNVVDQLYLIDSTGTKKTILARKRTADDDYAIGLVRLTGRDLDQNGFVDTFSCDEGFNCFDDEDVLNAAIRLPFLDSAKAIADAEITLPARDDWNTIFDPRSSDLVPISPLRTDIKDLKFILHPIEDPYKAFLETENFAHPTVTVIITVGLSEATEQDYPGEFEDVTVQTTVSAGVLGKISTYPPTRDVSWISELPIRPTF